LLDNRETGGKEVKALNDGLENTKKLFA